MPKTKTCITTIPFQGQDKDGNDLLKPVRYDAKGNARLAYGETRFPIIPVINGYAERGDRIRVIAILTDGENYKHNYDAYFVSEIDALVRKNDYAFDGIEIITSPDREDIETQLQLFTDIISKIDDNEELYTCITYGTKPTLIVQFIALNYAYKLKKNTTVGCVVYGRFMHKDQTGNCGIIYDQTALFFMDGIVSRLAEMKAPQPETAIRAMLGIGGTDDDE